MEFPDFSNPLTAMGLGVDYLGNPIPSGLDVGTEAANLPPPPLSSAQGFWHTLKNDVLEGVQWTEQAAADSVKAVYDTTKSAIGTVVEDVTAPIANAAKNTYTYLIVGVIVVAGALYFAGKGGLLKR